MKTFSHLAIQNNDNGQYLKEYRNVEHPLFSDDIKEAYSPFKDAKMENLCEYLYKCFDYKDLSIIEIEIIRDDNYQIIETKFSKEICKWKDKRKKGIFVAYFEKQVFLMSFKDNYFDLTDIEGKKYANTGRWCLSGLAGGKCLAGVFLSSHFITDCKTLQEYHAKINADRERIKQEEPLRKERERAKHEIWIKQKEQAYLELVQKYNEQTIPINEENLTIILEYYNTMNWGSWSLPNLDGSFSMNQYECNGNQATTISLSKKISYGDTMADKFVVGAPFGYLTKYERL